MVMSVKLPLAPKRRKFSGILLISCRGKVGVKNAGSQTFVLNIWIRNKSACSTIMFVTRFDWTNVRWCFVAGEPDLRDAFFGAELFERFDKDWLDAITHFALLGLLQLHLSAFLHDVGWTHANFSRRVSHEKKNAAVCFHEHDTPDET